MTELVIILFAIATCGMFFLLGQLYGTVKTINEIVTRGLKDSLEVLPRDKK